MGLPRKVWRIGLPILVLAVGFAIRVILVKTSPEPEEAPPSDGRALVEVVRAVRGDHEVTLLGQGAVLPARSVEVVPQITGQVVWIADQLIPGGRFEEGDTLLRIDSRDYQAHIAERAAALENAELEAEVESGRARVARREWDIFGMSGPEARAEQDPSLALHEPHVRNAAAAIRGARGALRRARHDFERAVVEAPFDAVVQTEDVDVGQVVGPGAGIAVLVATDAFWVRVSVPIEALSHVQVPGYNAEQGSEARLVQDLGDEDVVRTGHVLRMYGDLDPAGQMARLLIAVPDPLGRQEEEPQLPLLIGSFVQVEIDATPVRAAIEIPRDALRDGDRVWIMNAESALEIRDVAVVWRGRDSVLVESGVEPNERIVTSRLRTPVAGMPLRIGGAARGGARRVEASR